MLFAVRFIKAIVLVAENNCLSCSISQAAVSMAGLVHSASVTVPNFSDTYTVKGTLYIPYAEVKEPFYAYYDLDSGNSRIDYYGGMVKTYQLSNYGSKYGSTVKVVPVTTETELNKDTCLRINGSSNDPVSVQSILPDTTGFENLGFDVLNGVNVEKWRLVVTNGEKINKYNLWIRYKNSTKDPSVVEPIPVRYEMKGYNTLLGSHYDHYYLVYDWFTSDKPSIDAFNVSVTCGNFSNYDENHIYLFNPMKEFVHNYDAHVDQAFEKFKSNHSKTYDSDKEHTLRKEAFRQNLRFIHSKNRANLGYTLGINHLADRTDLEIRALRGKQYTAEKHYNGGLPFPYNTSEELDKLPVYIDWRLFGAVTPVKDQSVCGSCWSYGTTGAIEGAYFLKTGQLLRLSTQALIDCSWGYGNNGCDGGEDYRAYQWIIKHGGLPLEDEYGGYLGQDGYCHVNSVNLTAPIKGFVNVTSGDNNALKVAVAKTGPISVSIDASHKTFSFYSNGIYYEKDCGNKEQNLDHSVVLVGYGNINGEDYWLIKNSWSNYWGNDGYILMSPKDNNCGVATAPTYVTM
uniref:Counting factor associated protein D n=1 Tax=Timema shepardi TaxID=629360 RepID=A0A7R9AML3_TIMSH|nr:unnamed protein product [Timema shepardi]